MRILLFILTLFGTPALADPTVNAADVDMLAHCLDRFEGDVNAARMDCAGKIAQPCLGTSDGATTVGMGNCFKQEELAWQALRDEVLARLLEAAKVNDAYYTGQGDAGFATAVESLNAAEATWAPWRDAECRSRADDHGNGSMRRIVAPSCRMELMRERVLALWYR
ncbi:MAG: lysozyme inhibitor LprI family protein [Deltaproteobacteria bacterium]